MAIGNLLKIQFNKSHIMEEQNNHSRWYPRYILLALICHFNLEHSSFGTGNGTAECENCHIHTVGGSFHRNHHICSVFASLLNFLNVIAQVAYGLLKKLKFTVKVSLLLLDLFLFIDVFDKIYPKIWIGWKDVGSAALCWHICASFISPSQFVRQCRTN